MQSQACLVDSPGATSSPKKGTHPPLPKLFESVQTPRAVAAELAECESACKSGPFEGLIGV